MSKTNKAKSKFWRFYYSMPIISLGLILAIYLRSGFNAYIAFVMIWLVILGIIGFVVHRELWKTFHEKPRTSWSYTDGN